MENAANNHSNNTQQKTNTMAILGFVLAFLVPFVGLILSILGLREIKKNKKEKGEGLAAAGIVISIVIMVTYTIVASIVAGTMLSKIADNRKDIYHSHNNGGKTNDDDDDRKVIDGDDNGGASASRKVEKKSINHTITDSELGYKIVVKNAIINVPFDSDITWAKNYVGVAVEVEVTNNASHSGGIYASDLEVLADDDKGSSTSMYLNDYASANGLAALTTSGIRKGEVKSGWIFYYVDTDYSDLTFRYARDETKITEIGGANSGKTTTIPAKNFDVKL